MKTQKTTKTATKGKKPLINKDAQPAKTDRKPKLAKGAKQPKEGRSGSKKEIVLRLLRREQGATLSERSPVSRLRSCARLSFASSLQLQDV